MVILTQRETQKQEMYKKFYNKVIEFKRHIHKKKLAGQIDLVYTNLMDDINKLSTELSVRYGNDTAEEKDRFVQHNLNTLYKIYDTFYNKETKRVILTKDEISKSTFHGSVYRMYSKLCNITEIDKYFRYLPTRLFQDFIKGVTHFESDTVYDKPSYHRSGSCGKKDSEHLNRFKQNPDDLDKRVQYKKEALTRCYVERVLYEKLYELILHEQDPVHKLEIEHLQRMLDFFTYVQVIPKFRGVVPIQLSILVSLPNGKPLYQEDYRKFKNDKVIAVRKEGDVYKYKIQTYKKQTEWLDSVPYKNERFFKRVLKNLPDLDKFSAISAPNYWRPSLLSMVSRVKTFF